MRAPDHDAYPTRPRAELHSLANQTALGGPLVRRYPAPKRRALQRTNLQSSGTMETGEKVDSGYSSQNHEDASLCLRYGGSGARVAESSSTYGPASAAGESYAWWRVKDDEHLSPVSVEDATEEMDFYDEQGFLIESMVDLLDTLSLEDRDDEAPHLTPGAKECLPTLLIDTSPLETQSRRLSQNHFPPFSHRTLDGPQRTASHFSFTANTAEETLVARRDVVDTEKRRKYRQILLGLAGCDLTAFEEEERKKVLRDWSGKAGFVHRLGTSSVGCSEGLHGSRGRDGMGRSFAKIISTPDRRVSGTMKAEVAFGQAEMDLPVGYCLLCSSLHLGRRADAMDSIVEGLNFAHGHWSSQCGDVEDKPITTEEEGLEHENGGGRWCWLLRWFTCFADPEKEEWGYKGKGRIWDCKPKAERTRLRKARPRVKTISW